MTDETNINSNQPEPSLADGWVLVLIAIIFTIASLYLPQLAWLFLLGFLFVAFLLKNPFSQGGTIQARAADKQASQEEVDRLQGSVIDALQYPVFVIEQDGRVVHANRVSRDVFGTINKGERIFIRFRHPDLKNAIEKALRQKEYIRIEYNEPVPADRWFNVEVSPIRLVGNRSVKDQLFVIGFQELTEVKRIDQMRSDFIANASHELRTPLASLLGYLETIQGSAKDDPKAQERFVGTMLDQAQRMSRLVNDLLSLSQIEMKAHVRPSEKVELFEVVSGVVKSLEKLAAKTGVKIELEAKGKYWVKGDRDELVQVFENLIENAFKYGQAGKRVIVSITTDKQEKPASVRVSIKDFGPGIAMEHQHRITERFYRVDVARSREKQGTGLGLAIVKHILQRHGTRLKINSETEKGTEFIVELEAY